MALVAKCKKCGRGHWPDKPCGSERTVPAALVRAVVVLPGETCPACGQIVRKKHKDAAARAKAWRLKKRAKS